MKKSGQTSLLDRLLDPISRCLNPESAEALVKLRPDAKVQARIQKLAAKCNEDKLTAAERREYETYVHAGNLIAILQAKARLHLKQSVS